jgi:hypothetical protein
MALKKRFDVGGIVTLYSSYSSLVEVYPNGFFLSTTADDAAWINGILLQLL